jgi:hypothetical protein
MMKTLLLILFFSSSVFAMPVYEVTGNIAFDYFFSVNLNIGLPIWGFVAVLRLLRS